MLRVVGWSSHAFRIRRCELPYVHLEEKTSVYDEAQEIAEVTSHDFRLVIGKKGGLTSVEGLDRSPGSTTVRRRIGWLEERQY